MAVKNRYAKRLRISGVKSRAAVCRFAAEAVQAAILVGPQIPNPAVEPSTKPVQLGTTHREMSIFEKSPARLRSVADGNSLGW